MGGLLFSHRSQSPDCLTDLAVNGKVSPRGSGTFELQPRTTNIELFRRSGSRGGFCRNHAL